jgi:hypothetical protein
MKKPSEMSHASGGPVDLLLPLRATSSCHRCRSKAGWRDRQVLSGCRRINIASAHRVNGDGSLAATSMGREGPPFGFDLLAKRAVCRPVTSQPEADRGVRGSGERQAKHPTSAPSRYQPRQGYRCQAGHCSPGALDTLLPSVAPERMTIVRLRWRWWRLRS